MARQVRIGFRPEAWSLRNNSFANGVEDQIGEVARIELLLKTSAARFNGINAEIPQRGDLFGSSLVSRCRIWDSGLMRSGVPYTDSAHVAASGAG